MSRTQQVLNPFRGTPSKPQALVANVLHGHRNNIYPDIFFPIPSSLIRDNHPRCGFPSFGRVLIFMLHAADSPIFVFLVLWSSPIWFTRSPDTLLSAYMFLPLPISHPIAHSRKKQLPFPCKLLGFLVNPLLSVPIYPTNRPAPLIALDFPNHSSPFQTPDNDGSSCGSWLRQDH